MPSPRYMMRSRFGGPEPMENDLQYFSRRAAEELQAAARAESPEAQQSHRELAERYAVIVQERENVPAADPRVAGIPAE